MSTQTRVPFSALHEKGESNRQPITVMMIDDQAMVCEAVRRMLEDQEEIEFHSCQDPTRAMEMAETVRPTVILQDLIMPEVDGMTLVKFFRANPATKDVPMIVLSSKEEPDIKYQAFSLGANDYMVKLPDKLEVVARIRYHSMAYIHLQERNAAYEALVASQQELREELSQAENYVRSLLPATMSTDHLQTDWVFMTSTDLGGDSFGYHWIDDKHFALYVLDVCGHGVGAALLSVSAMNVLRASTLPDVDFRNPSAVLGALNNTFDMDEQGGMFFTIWYGVWNRESGELAYSSGGHPPAILVPEERGEYKKLGTGGMIIGGMPGESYDSERVPIRPGERLYVFSDGVYEVEYGDREGMMDVDAFADELLREPTEGGSKVREMVDFVRSAQGKADFDDDFSLLEVCFR